jgi:hypothetical protein
MEGVMVWGLKSARDGRYAFTSPQMHRVLEQQQRKFNTWMVESGRVVQADMISASFYPQDIGWDDLHCHGRIIGSVDRYDLLMLSFAFEIWSETGSVFASGLANIQFLCDDRPIELYFSEDRIRINEDWYDLADPKCVERILGDHFLVGNRI